MASLTRQNVLIVLSLVTIAGGAMFGAGAFTQVQADRTVTAATAGDGSAYLQLNGTSNYAAHNSNDELEVTLDSLNGNATTTVDNAFNITVDPSAPGSYEISIEDAEGGTWPSEIEFAETDGSSLTDGTGVTVAAGNTVQVQIVVDLSTEGHDVNNVPSEISIVADQV